MKHPSLSVVMSTYNDEKFIAEAIQSILDQTYPFFEFIIVNDGSTDNTLSVIKGFDDPRIVLIDKGNTGLPDSLNRGIQAARYDWIARMDADDVALPTRFENQVKLIRDGVGVIGGQIIKVDENNKIVSKSISRNPTKAARCQLYTLLGWNPVVHPTTLIKKELVIKCGGYDANFKAAQDFDLWSRMSLLTKIINTPELVLRYRVHSGSITSSRKGRQQMYAFLGLVKRGLMIDSALTEEQFKRIINNPMIAEAVKTNKKYSDILYTNIDKWRNVIMLRYYYWKVALFIRLRLNRKKFIHEIFG